MNHMIRNEWDQNGSKDTVASAGVIIAGLLVVIFAAFGAYTERAAQVTQTATQQGVQVQIAATAVDLKAAL